MSKQGKKWKWMGKNGNAEIQSGILDWCSFSYGAWKHSTKQGMLSNHEGYKKWVERCFIVRIVRSETNIDLWIINALLKYMFLCFNVYM